jgi:phage-related protein
MWHNMFPMDESAQSKSVIWMGSSLRDLKKFPAEVKDVMGYALYQAQVGGKAAAAKPLAGFGGATVLEIVEDFRGDTYRAVYTVKFSRGGLCVTCLSEEIEKRCRDTKV